MQTLRKKLQRAEMQSAFQLGFTAGRAAGARVAKGKAEKLRDSQCEKASLAWERESDSIRSAEELRGFSEGFRFGWLRYKIVQAKKPARKKKT